MIQKVSVTTALIDCTLLKKWAGYHCQFSQHLILLRCVQSNYLVYLIQWNPNIMIFCITVFLIKNIFSLANVTVKCMEQKWI